eukprot:1725308-Rhodomonas_salina.1
MRLACYGFATGCPAVTVAIWPHQAGASVYAAAPFLGSHRRVLLSRQAVRKPLKTVVETVENRCENCGERLECVKRTVAGPPATVSRYATRPYHATTYFPIMLRRATLPCYALTQSCYTLLPYHARADPLLSYALPPTLLRAALYSPTRCPPTLLRAAPYSPTRCPPTLLQA